MSSNKSLKMAKEKQRHQSDSSIWTPGYGERQKQKTIKEFCKVNVEEILSELKEPKKKTKSSRNSNDTEGIFKTDSKI